MINDQWLSGVPSLPTDRLNMGCYAVNDILYAIGGFGGNCKQSYDSQWQLATPSATFCIVRHGDDLIVIGGADQPSGTVLNDVNVINTVTGECVLAGTLSIGTDAPACILHQSTIRCTNILFIFGGFNAQDSWQFINLPTVDSTAVPTQSPSAVPTDSTITPSLYPSIQPTSAPTDATFAPSLSRFPTFNPTKTKNQSFDPSLPPTNIPSVSEPTIRLHAHDATLSLRDTTVYPITGTNAYDTAGVTEDIKSKRDSEFVMDELMIVVCGSLCLISVIVVVIIYGRFKKIKISASQIEMNCVEIGVIDQNGVVMAYTNEGTQNTSSEPQ
eukprot:235859_1